MRMILIIGITYEFNVMNEDVRDVVYIVAMNDIEIIKMIDTLIGCVVKRISKGKDVDLEYLAYSSMMGKITLAAKRLEEKCGGHVTKEERNFGAHQLAEYIISEAKDRAANKAV